VKARSLALSVLAHAALFAGVVAYGWTRERSAEVIVTAPAGSVFSQEATRNPSPNPRPSPIQNPESDSVSDSVSEAVSETDSDSGLGSIPVPYPPVSRKLGEEGEVVLALRLNTDGKVTGAAIERSSGFPRLDEAARAALIGARFPPGGEERIFRVEFRLTGK
jgi:protein TonB